MLGGGVSHPLQLTTRQVINSCVTTNPTLAGERMLLIPKVSILPEQMKTYVSYSIFVRYTPVHQYTVALILGVTRIQTSTTNEGETSKKQMTTPLLFCLSTDGTVCKRLFNCLLSQFFSGTDWMPELTKHIQ